MTNPLGGQLKTGPSPLQANAVSVLGVTVMSVDPGAKPPVAIARDPIGRDINVRIDFQRGRGSIPKVGERWIIDQSMGFWTFACLSNGDPSGAGSAGDMNSVDGLGDVLGEHNTVLDDVTARLNELLSQATVSAVTATTADITLTDGTTLAGCQVAGAYQPTVGDLVWTQRADGAGNRVVLGPAGSAATNLQVANLTASGNVSVIGGWTVGKDQYGNPSLWTNWQGGSALMAGVNGIYFLDPANTRRLAIHPRGWDIDTDTLGNSCLLANLTSNAGIVSSGNQIYVVQSNNTLAHAPLTASVLNSDGDVRAAGGLYGNGLALGAGQINCGPIWAMGTHTLGLNVNGGLTVGGDVGVNYAQIICNEHTVGLNLAVGGTFFYRGIAQPVAPSERSLKEHIENLDDPFPYLDSLVAARFRWLNPDYFDDEEHVGVYVDEMDEADPATVRHPELSIDNGIDEETAETWRAHHGRYPDERSLIAYLVRAVQRLNTRLKEIEQ